MSNINKICEICGKLLRPTQYARRRLEDQLPIKESDVFVCRNYPNCPKAEKESNK